MERIVMKGKYYPRSGGKLTFDAKEKRYTCYYAGQKLWSEFGFKGLYEYVTSGEYYEDEAQIGTLEEREAFEKKLFASFPILQMYRDTCEFEGYCEYVFNHGFLNTKSSRAYAIECWNKGLDEYEAVAQMLKNFKK